MPRRLTQRPWTHLLVLVPALMLVLVLVLPLLLSLVLLWCFLRERSVLVIRPRNFNDHSIFFVARCHKGVTLVTTTESVVELNCWRVPQHLRQRPWTHLLPTAASDSPISSASSPSFNPAASDLTHRLVLLNSSPFMARILSRFEDPSFIHVYLSSSNGVSGGIRSTHDKPLAGLEQQQQLLLELPRYDLEFEVKINTGEIVSRDYSDYRLRRRQLLVEGEEGAGNTTAAEEAGAVKYTLPEFQQYLILERIPQTSAVVGPRQENVLVLVPAGSVAVGRTTACDGGDGDLSPRPAVALAAEWNGVRLDISKQVGAQLKVGTIGCAGRQTGRCGLRAEEIRGLRSEGLLLYWCNDDTSQYSPHKLGTMLDATCDTDSDVLQLAQRG